MKLLITLAILVALILIAAYLRHHSIDESSVEASNDPPIDPRLADFVSAIHSVESEEEPVYLRAIVAMQEDPESTVALIRDSLRRAERHSGLTQDLVMALAALAHPAALPLLVEIAQRPVRSEASSSARETDSMIRSVAVEGIEALGTQEQRAVEALIELTESEDRSVQTAAVVALTHNAWGLPAAEKLRETLPYNRRFLLEVRRSQVRDVPQVSDPTRHLLESARSRDERPSPEFTVHRIAPATRLTPSVRKGV